jgi:hypothetical protein
VPSKRIPDPARVRRVPSHFSWVDHRLVRLGHIRGRSCRALAVYLFLVTVGDADGVSWYGDERIAVELGLSVSGLHQACDELELAGLIAYDAPFYQVLELPLSPCSDGPRGRASRRAQAGADRAKRQGCSEPERPATREEVHALIERAFGRRPGQ